MNFSLIQLTVVLFVPTALTTLTWRRSQVSLAKISLSFFLGGVAVWPIATLAGLLASASEQANQHFYWNALIDATLGAALPEELGKGLIVASIVSRTSFPRFLPAWLAIGTAVPCGFAAVEGLLSAIANEGVLKVLIGRSLGALSHSSWGLICAWFVWRTRVRPEARCANWAAALLVPVALHAILNASMVEVPGADLLPEGAAPPMAAILIMISGIVAFLTSFAGAMWVTVRARRVQNPASDPPAAEAALGIKGLMK